jgi:hypothetical protein
MPGIAESDAYECLKTDWGGPYAIDRVHGETRPYRAQFRDDPAAPALEADTPGQLRELIRDDYMTRHPAAASEGGTP